MGMFLSTQNIYQDNMSKAIFRQTKNILNEKLVYLKVFSNELKHTHYSVTFDINGITTDPTNPVGFDFELFRNPNSNLGVEFMCYPRDKYKGKNELKVYLVGKWDIKDWEIFDYMSYAGKLFNNFLGIPNEYKKWGGKINCYTFSKHLIETIGLQFPPIESPAEYEYLVDIYSYTQQTSYHTSTLTL